MREAGFSARGGGAEPKARMIWLPGAYHSRRDFLDAGFEAAVRARGLDLELVFADLEMAHLGDRSLLARLREREILPALAGGIAVWLGGISLGGLFALDYADSHPGEIAGLCLLAPYLGNRSLIAELAAPRLPDRHPDNLAQDDVERRIWRFIRSGRNRDAAPIHLGYGLDDRFASAHALMARSLPPRHVRTTDGGHDWPTWSRLWEDFLDSHWT